MAWRSIKQASLAASPLAEGVKVTPLCLIRMGDYTVAIWATIGLIVVFTVPVVWQFLQPNDDDFGDITKRPK